MVANHVLSQLSYRPGWNARFMMKEAAGDVKDTIASDIIQR
jgi:hypothetical protein